MIEITPTKLFKIGIACFSISGVATILGLYTNWAITNIYGKISTMANIVFTFALVFSFAYLLDQQKQTILPEPNDINKIIEEFKHGRED